LLDPTLYFSKTLYDSYVLLSCAIVKKDHGQITMTIDSGFVTMENINVE